MATKKVGVRLVAENGQRVKAELEGIGKSGEAAFEKIEAKSKVMSRAVIAAFAAVAAAAVAGLGMLVRSSLETVDAQAKLAQSMGTTVESIQALQWAGELAGVSLGEIEQAAGQLTRRLSQAAAGSGPAVDALERLGLTAKGLMAVPLDQRVAMIQDALNTMVPAAERAAVAAQLFGNKAGLAFTRIDTATLKQAQQDVQDFGVAVSQADAAKIEMAGDAIARLSLIWTGLGNQLAVAVAPSLQAAADAMAAVASRSGPLGQAIQLVFGNLERLATYAATFATFLAVRWVGAFAIAAAGTVTLSGALGLLRLAILRTGFGALIIGAGELVIWFGKLVKATGGWGAALEALGQVAVGVWNGITTSASAIPPALGAIWQTVVAGFYGALEAMQRRWADFLHKIAGGLQGLPGMEEAVLAVHGAAVTAGSSVYEFGAAADAASGQAAALKAEAAALATGGFDMARDAVARLGEIMASASEEGAAELPAIAGAADEVTEALEGTGKAGGGAGKAVAEGAKEATDALKEQEKAADEAKKKMEETAQGLAGDLVNPIKDALKSGEFSFQTFATAISNIAKNLAARLIDAAFKPIENALISALSGGSGGGGGGLLGGLTSLFGGGAFAKGGVFAGGHEVTAFARGGVVAGPTVFPFANGIGLMGEAGPEAIMPLARGPGGRLGVTLSEGMKPQAAESSTRIVNVLDPSVVGDYLATPSGERAIVNVIRRNRSALNG